MYDYLIVGAGLTGALYAYFLKQKYKVLVIEKNSYIGGNLYTEEIEGIMVHKYGPHIFHTDDKKVWDFMRSLDTFNNYIHTVKVTSKNRVYSLPFNMNTFNEVFGFSKPYEAERFILSDSQTNSNNGTLEEQAIKQVGVTLYHKFIKGYTEKQWGKSCSQLPASIIKRIPVRYTYNNNYFNSRFQGIPEHGYTYIINKLLDDVEIQLNTDYNMSRDYYNNIAKKIIYTGPIDTLHDFNFGALEYRSVKFEEEVIDTPNYQGTAVMNFSDADIPYTRIIEHKFFTGINTDKTIISREYSHNDGFPAYPINTEYNQALYNKYKAITDDKIILKGRLAEYKYYDMDNIVSNILEEFNG